MRDEETGAEERFAERLKNIETARLDQREAHAEEATRSAQSERFAYEKAPGAFAAMNSRAREMVNAANKKLTSDRFQIADAGGGFEIWLGAETVGFAYSQPGGNFGHRILMVSMQRRSPNFAAFRSEFATNERRWTYDAQGDAKERVVRWRDRDSRKLLSSEQILQDVMSKLMKRQGDRSS